MDFLIGIASSIVATSAEYTVKPLFRQLGYLFYYNKNVDNLKIQIQELGYTKDRLQHRIEEARRNGEEIEGDVEHWLSDVDTINEEYDDFLRNEDHAKARCSCNNGAFPSLLSRHQLSRKAKKMVQVVLSEIGACKFDKVSYRPCIPTSVVNKGYEDFESRAQTLREIIEALKDMNIRMIGIYGMGGIGKTVLAKEVARIAKEEKLFDKVSITTVSQTPDVHSIQQEIAEQVGVEKFHEIKSQSVRADRLRHRLSQEKSILVILDDVWKELNLSAVGIDFVDDQKGCRILLTSRSLNVLQDHMGADRNIEIKVLRNVEAMDLFKKNAGISNENVKFQPLVRDIVKECAGLPIAITTVAHALKNKSLSIWEDALLQLKRSIATNIEGMDQKVYASIKLSYDFLEGDDEAKSLLLLCSLHGEDAIIKVEDLMIYGVGWGLFLEVYTVEEARNRVDSLVNKLKWRCLLLDGGSDGTDVKVHDIIRDVMLSIASEDRQMHHIANIQKFDRELSPKKRLTDSIAISLFVSQDDNKLPEKLECPQLELLLVFGERRNHLQIPEQYFEEKKELKVLRLNKVYAGLLPTSFTLLQNLQALSLYMCMGNVALIGELKNLKMLDLSESSIEELPEHIGQLTHLQMLNLNYCERLEVIQPGVISSLLRLEELHMKGVPLKWEAEGVLGERSNASLVELQILPHLSTVCLSIPDIDVLPKALFSEKLKRFELSLGKIPYGWHIVKSEFKNHNSLRLTLSGHNLIGEYGLEVIIKRSEVLYLYGFAGVNNVVYELNEEGFRQVKSFGFGDNNDVQYVVNATGTQPCSVFQNLEQLCLVRLMNLEKIYCGELTAQSFGKLRFITVEGCDRLKNLFSSSIARKFEEITVTNCKMMKEIVVHEIEHDAHNSADKIEFLELRSLILKGLPEFVDFFRSEMETSDASLLDYPMPLFSKKVVFPRLETLELSGMKFKDLFSDQLPTTFHLPNLTELSVYGCNNLKHLLSFDIARNLVHLKNLWVYECMMMEEILITKLEKFCAGDSIEFPLLQSLRVGNCPRLKTFIANPISGEIKSMIEQSFFSEKVVFPRLETLELSGMKFKDLFSDQLPTTFHLPNLTELRVSECNNLKHLFSFDIARNLAHLKHLNVKGCMMMEEILITKEQREGSLERICFPKLRILQLISLPKLEKFCVGDFIEFPLLSFLRVQNCPRLKTFIANPISGEIKSMIEQPFFSEKVMFPELKSLDMDVRQVIKEMRHPQSPAVHFCMLRSLRLTYNDEKSAIFPFEFIQRFKDLEDLSLGGSSVEEICQHQETDALQEPDGPLLHVRELRLEFNNLRHLFENAENVKPRKAFQNIEVLVVYDCGSLEKLVPFLEAFRNLKDLRVSSCDGMTNLLSSSTAKSLVQLTRMSIDDCKQIREIVACKEGETEDEFSFGRLRILVLHNLPSLESFYSGNAAMRLPLLEKLILSQCSEMRSFSRGIITTQKLNEIFVGIVNADNMFDWIGKGWMDEIEYDCVPRKQIWEGDINSTVQKIWEDYSNSRGDSSIEKNIQKSGEEAVNP